MVELCGARISGCAPEERCVGAAMASKQQCRERERRRRGVVAEVVTHDEISQHSSSPFKGEARRGMGAVMRANPIPTLTLPLKGRECDGLSCPALPAFMLSSQ